jgi:hypothetical protein
MLKGAEDAHAVQALLKAIALDIEMKSRRLARPIPRLSASLWLPNVRWALYQAVRGKAGLARPLPMFCFHRSSFMWPSWMPLRLIENFGQIEEQIDLMFSECEEKYSDFDIQACKTTSLQDSGQGPGVGTL